jgi:hypothetical protein
VAPKVVASTSETTMNRLLIALIALPFAAVAQTPIADLPVERLKAAYLACDHVSSQRPLMQDEAQLCVEIADALKMRHFDGDFNRLIAWWRAEKQQRAAALASKR